MELGLGTVQFGLDYGISNSTGRTSEHEVRQILQLATENNLRVLDTATAYGESENVLGRCLPSRSSFRIVTKTPPLKEIRGNVAARKTVNDSLADSLKRLGVANVYGLLVHHADDLLGPNGDAIWGALVEMRARGIVQRLGLSVYSGVQIDAALDKFDFDLIQLPLNVFDQRLVVGGQLARLKKRGIEIHARSVFLQGLVLSDPDAIPDYFAPIRSHLLDWRATIKEWGLTPAQAALAYARSQEIDVVLVGVESTLQLRANLKDFTLAKSDGIDFQRFALNDDSFLNPSRWKLSA